MTRQRIRIRFCKQSDMRLVGHRDLARTFERLFRRAGLELRMSEGFHPKAKMSFPLALAVGIEGVDEVLEVELLHPVPPGQLLTVLAEHAVPGLSVRHVEILDASAPKAQVKRVEYQIPVPEERRPGASAALTRLRAQPMQLLRRSGQAETVDLCEDIEALDLTDGVLRIQQRITGRAGVKPRDILHRLGLEDLESRGCALRRTAVELVS